MRLSDRLVLFIVWMLPKRIVYWCAVRLMSHATTGKWSDQTPDTLFAMDALDRWNSI